MTENELRQKYVDKICSWEGYSVADGRHKQIVDIYNNDKPLPANYTVKYTDAWCATTVSAAAIECKLTDIIPKECSCGRMIQGFQKIGRFMEKDDYTPKIGDIIFFDWQDTGIGDNTGWPDHVGVVRSISGDSITTIEGNISKKVGGRTIKVNSKNIRGYGIPDYVTKAQTMQKPTVPVSPSNNTVTPNTYTTGKVYTISVSNTLNIRDKSNTFTGKIIGSFKNGSKITPLKKENNMVYFEGWCSTNYLKP